MTENLKLGMQGWSHQEWVGPVYPATISSSELLAQYATRFPTVEVDETFYGIPPAPLVQQWRDSVDSSFLFAPKVPQQITHEQRFASGGALLRRFLDRISLLGETLGPLLLLAPPGFLPDNENKATLNRFLKQLPSDFSWALEVKHAGWCTEEYHELLSSSNVALVAGTSRWLHSSLLLKLAEMPTAEFAYIRWNNTSRKAAQLGDTVVHGASMDVWKEKLARLCGLVRAAYGYFHRKAFGDGLHSANELQYLVEQLGSEAPASLDGESR